MTQKPSSTSQPVSPLILLSGGDYWHEGFAGLDNQDRGRDNHGDPADFFDNSQSDSSVISHGILLEGLKPLHHHALKLLACPLDEANPEKFINGLLSKIKAPQPLSAIHPGLYYQSSLAMKKSGMLTMRLCDTEAMVYIDNYRASENHGVVGFEYSEEAKQRQAMASPFIHPVGAGWQLLRARGKKPLHEFLSSFIAMPLNGAHHETTPHNFYRLNVLSKTIYLFHQGDEALFFIPRSIATSMLCHLAMVAATKSHNLTRVRIYY